MAWLKDIENESGVVVGCWAVKSIHFNALTGKANIYYCGWVSKDAKEDGKNPVETKEFEMDASVNPQLLATAMAAVEAGILQLPEFDGASVDV